MRVIRVTTEGNYRPRMMSDRANAFIQGDTAIVFCAANDGPQFFKVDLSSGEITRLGNLLGGVDDRTNR